MRKKKIILSALTLSMVFSMSTLTVQADNDYKPGYTIEKNTDFPNSDADYQVTFVYEDKDARDATKVELFGGFQFYQPSEVGEYDASGDNSSIPVYSPEQYKKGMFVAGNSITMEMEEVKEEVFKITLPLPGNQYYYDFNVYYEGSEKSIQIKDPINPAPGNANSGYDAGHSLLLVGNAENTAKGQEKIYPRTDGKNGQVEWVEYTAVDGSKQHLGVYKPYHYSPSKIYKTIYVSHGGGGNESEWMTIGSIPHIMDNLIAEGEMAEAIVVTMDNQHTFGGWNYDQIAKNLQECMIPYIESHYSVSKSADDRAFCGLSMGSMTTNQMVKMIPETFRYYGAFSGGSVDLDPTHYDVDKISGATYYLTAGCIDMAYNNKLGISSVDYMKMLDQLGIKYKFDLKMGAHDWYVWRDSYTTFAKDYLWDTNDELKPAGVTVEKNSSFKDVKDSAYQATFVYEDKDERDAVSVSVSGNLQFYKHDDVTDNFIKTGSAAGAQVYNVYEYQDGMFNTGYGLNGDSQSYDLTEVKEERFEITLPLPGNLYYYDYTVTYADGSTEKIQDPANRSEANPFNNHDSGHSLFYVGDENNTLKGQEKIYARTDDKTGSYSFVEYQAVDGTTQPLGIYLPHGYDSSKTYKTIYVSHGGGGNEAEWMGIGAVPNIMDNLIAEGKTAEAIVVTMDNTYFKWDYAKIAENLEKHIIPFVEKNYSVSKKVKDRALCGLSMGSMTTSTILQEYTDMFGYYGCFSGANMAATIKDADKLKNVVIYLTAGSVDMALKAPTDEGDVGNPGKTVGLAKTLDKLGVEYGMDVKDGAHDWGVWRAAYTTFVADYLWESEDENVKPQQPNEPQQPNKGNESVKTGDYTSITLFGSLLILSTGAYIYIKKYAK